MFRTAFRFIRYDKAKSIGALIGIIISTFLVGQQSGIYIFLTNQMKRLVSINEDYVWVTDNKTNTATNLGVLDMRIAYLLGSIPGIQEVSPIFTSGAVVQFPGGKASGVKLIGVSPNTFAGLPGTFVSGGPQDLLPDGAVTADLFNEGAFEVSDPGTTFELNGRRAYIAARTEGMNGFDGTYVFTTIDRARMLAGVSNTVASAFLVKAQPHVSKDSLISMINSTVHGVRAWRGEDFSASTVSFILGNTGIATSLGTLIIFAFIAGFFIIGLILYSAAVDRIRDYGTIKAIGATNGYIRKLIYTQALIFAVAGFLTGFLLLTGFRAAIARAGVFFEYPYWYLLLLFMLIMIIAIGGATFAVRRITRVEPAQVFKL